MHRYKPSGIEIRHRTDNHERNQAFFVSMLKALLFSALFWTAGCDGGIQAPSDEETIETEPAATTQPIESSVSTQTGGPSESATPTSTNTKTHAPSATQDLSAVEGLKEELLFSGGGGDGALCLAQPEGVEPPTVTGRGNHGSGFMCLYGFPLGEMIQVQLLDPAGKAYGPRVLTNENSIQSEKVIQVSVWFPGLPSGEWRVVANSPSVQVDAQFQVEETSHPSIGVIPKGDVDVFDGDRWLFWWIANTYLSSEEIRVLGSGFPPGSSLPLGIYTSQGAQFPSTLSYSQYVSIDDQGKFETTILLESFASIGGHCAVVLIDPEYEPSILSPSDLGANQCFVIEQG